MMIGKLQLAVQNAEEVYFRELEENGSRFDNDGVQNNSITVCRCVSEFGFKACRPFEETKLTLTSREKHLSWTDTHI
jgi:hypothetical protein